MDLSLDVEQNSSVSACLRNFSSTETLTKKNKFFCESCNALQVREMLCIRCITVKFPRIYAFNHGESCCCCCCCCCCSVVVSACRSWHVCCFGALCTRGRLLARVPALQKYGLLPKCNTLVSFGVCLG